MTKYTKGSGKKLPQRFLQNAIIKLLRRKPGKAFSVGNISTKLKTKNSKDSVKNALESLQADHKIVRDRNNKYIIHPSYQSNDQRKKAIQLEGRADLTATGGAYIIVDGQERDIYIPKRYVNGALQGDTVLIEAILSKKGRRPEGKIKSIIKRKRSSFIGTFQDFKKRGYVFVETPLMSLDIRVLPKDFNAAKNGDAVIVEVTDFGHSSGREMLGKVIEVLNQDDKNDFEMNAILVNNGFEIAFPEEVIKESASLSENISQDEIERRRDMREVLTFTIDPLTAKDFDDAISYRKLENGIIEIGVHIADVTHFVRPGTSLDKDAYKRSTSVYLVDRVCPMLPEKISNELCSLRPHEDKLSFSTVFTFNSDRQIIDTWMGKTVIHSDRRFTYEEAQEVLEGKRKELYAEISHVNTIAKSLNKKRFKEGSINFESDEVRFELDDAGTPINIHRKVRKDAHKLIEEFMLLANQKVAKFMAKRSDSKEVPYVYRIHDLPDPDRLTELALLASEFGIKLNFDSPKLIAKSLNSLSQNGTQEDIMQILKPLAIRSMAKAAYASDNIGHYGLGFEYYSHFTSPIRRYSDVLAHRILFDNLENINRSDKDILEERCHYISLKERDAIYAERESVKFKQVEYFSSRIGSIESGIIRNIIDKGFFIELSESQADGFIPLGSLDERVMIHPARIKVTGLTTGKIWRIGDSVSVIIEDVNLNKRQIDLKFSDITDNEEH